MNVAARQASLAIDAVAKAVANWTVAQHAASDPGLVSRYGDSWRADWIGHSLSQVNMLAQAVAVESCELFASSVRWMSASFKARGVDDADLKQNLCHMGEVLVKELPPSVVGVAKEYVDASVARLGSPVVGEPVPGATECHDTALVYLEALLEGDRTRAESAVFTSLAEGMTITDIYEHILAPAQARLGYMWHRGEIGVADEHVGSAITQTIMSLLRPHFGAAASHGKVVVGTSTHGDFHEIGLRMVIDAFEIDGWGVVYLGANTPITDIVDLLETRRPNLLALSVSTTMTIRDAGDLIDAVRSSDAARNTKILIGGAPFKAVENLWSAMGADGCANMATAAVKLGNELVSS